MASSESRYQWNIYRKYTQSLFQHIGQLTTHKSVRDAPGELTLKVRKYGQGTNEELMGKDLIRGNY